MASGQVSGLLNINKPKGITSHDVVAQVRKISGRRKVGHTGTLDPMATGVLLVCVGQATRLIEYIMPGRKQYRATIHFGISTDTFDADGKIVDHQDISTVTEAQLKEALSPFKGDIIQYPPVFSAIKKNGKPLYKRARAGEKVDVPSRSVVIYELNWVSWHAPYLTVDVTCSPGTYIRSLAHDLGQAMGTGAHLGKLVRTANGVWTLDQAISLDTLKREAETCKGRWQQFLQSPDRAIVHLPKVVLTEDSATDIKHGRKIVIADDAIKLPDPKKEIGDLLRTYLPNGQFLAILKRPNADECLWKPKKVFHST